MMAAAAAILPPRRWLAQGGAPARRLLPHVLRRPSPPPLPTRRQRFFNGHLAHLFVFNGSLSADQLAAIYQAGVSAGKQAQAAAAAASPAPSQSPAANASTPAASAAARGVVPAADCTSACQQYSASTWVCTTATGLMRTCTSGQQQQQQQAAATTGGGARPTTAATAVSTQGGCWGLEDVRGQEPTCSQSHCDGRVRPPGEHAHPPMHAARRPQLPLPGWLQQRHARPSNVILQTAPPARARASP